MNHGTETSYRKGCRCDECSAASARNQLGRRQRAKLRFQTEGPAAFRHATRWTYEAGCRCDECVEHHNDYKRRMWAIRPERRIRDDPRPPTIPGDLTARRTDPPPALSTPRARPVYGCDCGATFTDRRDIARHECAA